MFELGVIKGVNLDNHHLFRHLNIAKDSSSEGKTLLRLGREKRSTRRSHDRLYYILLTMNSEGAS
jgi:hypothetical protein